ncbi:hypothetical protein OVA26_16750 [Microbacterium sp. SL62]|uniref:hypothetical protein n=1 Tax=Microbacterium sp. SL62 TaxID=2995139 RepID=UPI002273825E|nr:hypothetical protein [Microbacterium sp. SL62]MCY1718588.1 hypothetical protein [Microbacterium sp. SL62]
MTEKPEYSKAKVVSHPSGTEGEMHVDFRVDGVPYPIELSEKVYDAWSLHR